MADQQSGRHVASQSAEQALNPSLNTTMARPIVSTANHSRQFEPPDEQDFSQLDLNLISTFSDEDAESLIGPSMSRAATRLKSPKTPALEKKNALEEAIGYYDGGPDTPPADLEEFAGEITPELPDRTSSSSLRHQHGRGLSLGNLPPALPEASDLPTPWHTGPKTLVVAHDRSQTALQSVFGSGTERKRALSGGAEVLKKFLPSLPSMAQVGNYFITGTSGISQKSKHSSPPSPSKSPDRLGFGIASSSPRNATVQSRFDDGYAPQVSKSLSQNPLRRVSSDDSLLYHTLSRASSLGDDTLFESQRFQVNSRAKAIRDSLQDRSSFRMPNMPAMPSLSSLPSLPNFNFNMSFLNNENSAARARTDSSTPSNMIADNSVPFKRPASLSNPVGVRGRASSPPKAVPETVKTSEGPTKFLDNALETLTGDIVIMGGYRGSILRSTKTNRQVWAPVKIGLNIRKVDLEVGLEPEDEERMEETIYPSGMLQGIGPVDISRRLFKRLNACENVRNGKLRVWDYGYDWRLSPHLLSRKLAHFLENLPSNMEDGSGHKRGALVVAHSLGGLITRHVVNHRPDLFSGVIYAGVPQQCVNILGPLRNGDAVLLSSRILTAQVNFTLRTSFLLLPEDGKCFVDINTRERYPVDFFDVDDWIKYRLSPCTDSALPPYSQRGALGSLVNLNISGSKLSIPLPGKKAPGSQTGSITPPAPETTSINGGKQGDHQPSKTTRAANVLQNIEGGKDRTIAPQMGNNSSAGNRSNSSTTGSISTAVTIPRDKAITYLRRTLAETKKFKEELYFQPELSNNNKYPPMAVIYGKSIPTCCGAKVDGIESIPCADVYDNLAFAAGDGVCLAKEAMLPPGYQVINGGRIRSDRGHVTLLGDLNAIGRAIDAVGRGRAKGIGLGRV